MVERRFRNNNEQSEGQRFKSALGLLISFINEIRAFILMKKRRTFKTESAQNIPNEKKDRKGLYLAIFLASIMILSIGGVFLWNPESDSGYSYGKYSFANKNNLWAIKLNNKEVNFYFLPQQVENINISERILYLIKSSNGVLLLTDPEENSSLKLQAIDIFKFEMFNTFVNAYPQKQMGFAFTKPVNNSKTPVLTCSNSSYLFPAINLIFSNETNIKEDNTCIIVSSTDEYALLSLLDAMRYRLYGIIK